MNEAAAARRVARMPLACGAAMVLGLCIDSATVHPEALAALCARADTLAQSWATHRRAMPATTLAMLAAPLAMVLLVERPLNLADGLAQAAGQLLGWLAMLAGVPAAGALALRTGSSGFAAMTLAMAGAMLAGHVATLLISRTCRAACARVGARSAGSAASRCTRCPATLPPSSAITTWSSKKHAASCVIGGGARTSDA